MSGISSTDERNLVRLCRLDDRTAWDELVRRFTPLVYRIAYRMLNNTDDAADVSQETFIKVLESFDSFDASRTLAPWISKIVYHQCLKRLQSSRVKRTQSLEASDDISDATSAGPDSVILAKTEQEVLFEAMQELSAQDRALLHLRYKNDFTDVELGEVTGIPVNTIKTRIFRARTFLKQSLLPHFKKE